MTKYSWEAFDLREDTSDWDTDVDGLQADTDAQVNGAQVNGAQVNDAQVNDAQVNDDSDDEVRAEPFGYTDRLASPAIPRLKYEGKCLVPRHSDVRIGHALIMKSLGITDLDVYLMLVTHIADYCCVGGDQNRYAARANVMLCCIREIKPKSQLEMMLAMNIATSQMFYMKAGQDFMTYSDAGRREHAARRLKIFAKMMTEQIDALKRLRSTGDQTITVQYINVQDNGRAIVGDVTQNSVEAGNTTTQLSVGNENKTPTTLGPPAERRITVRRRKAAGQ